MMNLYKDVVLICIDLIDINSFLYYLKTYKIIYLNDRVELVDLLNINIFMKNIYKKTYENINEIIFGQKDNLYTINNIPQGEWDVLITESRNQTGLYLYNPLYISQVYSDKKLDIKDSKLEILFNQSDKLKKEDKSIKNKNIKLFENGLSIDSKMNVYPSGFFNYVVGFLILLDR